MGKKLPSVPSRDDALRMLAALAGGKANDCARLALEESPALEELDLTLLQEIRRGSGGAIEVRLADRLWAVELLLSLLEPEGNDAESFFAGLEQASSSLATR